MLAGGVASEVGVGVGAPDNGVSSEVNGGAMSVLWRKVMVSASSNVIVASTPGTSSVRLPDGATATVVLSFEIAEDEGV